MSRSLETLTGPEELTQRSLCRHSSLHSWPQQASPRKTDDHYLSVSYYVVHG